MKIEFCLELRYLDLGFILFIPEQARLSKRKMQPAFVPLRGTAARRVPEKKLVLLPPGVIIKADKKNEHSDTGARS
ncbi:MAG: hypothetical protein NTV89_09680 [Proteobacteria bacterium]|nr:hypothetical protein [Pseudomonadota bacterium]